MTSERIAGSNDALNRIPVDIWRNVLAAAREYESQWQEDPSTDPTVFANKYPEIPKEILICQLQQLQQELNSGNSQILNRDNRGGRFTTIRLIRTGGMGAIFLAIDHDCNRQVAIKKIRREFQDSLEAQRRFHSEAELTAVLEHPGIIPIYAKGVDDQGQDFYAMRLIDPKGACTLSDAIDEFYKSLSAQQDNNPPNASPKVEKFRQLIRHLVNVADTIAYAHAKGIVHRDIKPTNVLIGPYGETLIADWGLARYIWEPEHKTTGDTATAKAPDVKQSAGTTDIGTRGYAAPELNHGSSVGSLILADIYSLGATLYSILHNESPQLETINTQKEYWEPLIHIAPRIDALKAIARKAMALSPDDRYPSAEMFRQDLLSWIAGEPVFAYREPWLERALRWVGKHRTMSSALASGIAIAMIAGSMLLWLQAHQKQVLDDKANQLSMALNESARLLVETRDAQAMAEVAEKKAEERRKIANENKDIAHKREGLAFEALLRFQDILLANQAVFQSEKLLVVQEQLVTQTKATFAGILGNLSENSSPQPQTPRYLQVLTHRLAAMERLAGRTDQALEVIDQACLWMQRCLELPDLETAVRTDLQYRIGELKSLQGSLASLAGHFEKAAPMIELSIECLEPLVRSGQISEEDRRQIRNSLSQAYSVVATIESSRRNFAKAKSALGNSLKLIDTEPPTDHLSAMAIVQTRVGLAILHEQSGEPSEAIDQVEKAAAGLQAAEDLAIGNVPLEFIAYRSALAHHRTNLLKAQRNPAKAIEVMEKQLQHDSIAVGQYCGNPICLDAYTKTASALQALYVEAQQRNKALDLCRDWSVLSNRMVLEEPLSEPVCQFAIIAEHIAGHLDQQSQALVSAESHYREAIELCRKAESHQLLSARVLDQRVELEMHLFDLRIQSMDMDAAEKHFEHATDAAHQLLAFPQAAKAESARALGQLQQGINAMHKANQPERAALWKKTLRFKNLIDSSVSD